MSWRDQAACHGEDTTLFYPEELPAKERPRAESVVRTICESCPVSAACLEDALIHENGVGRSYRFGIFGGLTPAQRAGLGYLPRTCVECGESFIPGRGNQITCAKKCRNRRHERQKLESQRASA